MLKIMNSAHSGMNKWALGKLCIHGNEILLDIGCGGGNTIKCLSEFIKDGKIYGIDYSEQAVKESIQKNIQEINRRKVHISRADVTNIPFPEQTLDKVKLHSVGVFFIPH
ncbi:class I SAM-dependent methyltransferase [Bacillus manliponensis]|uniref:class I SAM-dependent methyltransferase n=1 Tax=Bacillus manliponensis TaxID=574376 RepID=UPI00068FAD90|nr:class I SAM-dependent methyltransferase [Bacillus manliponensis]